MSPHQYLCPKCGVLLQATQNVVGRKVQCRSCQSVFTAGPQRSANPIPKLSEPLPAPHRRSQPAVPERPVRAKRRSAFPLVIAGGLLAAAGLALGVVAWVRTEKPREEGPPLVRAPIDPVPEQPGRPEPPAGTFPLPSDLSFYVRPEPGQEQEEDLPEPIGVRPKARPDPRLPAIGPSDPAAPPVPPETKTDVPTPAPAAPKPPADPPAKSKPADPTPSTPVEPKQPTPADAPTFPTVPAQARAAYAAIDAHALRAPPEAEATLPALADYLQRGAKTDREKARAAYRWVTDRIVYDAEALFAGRLPDPSAEFTFSRRMGVCEGIANLFVELSEKMGLEAHMVGGYVKGLTDAPGTPVARPDHAWSVVRFDGRWGLVDATWGAGSLDGRQFRKEFTDFYFLTPPDRLIFTHLPERPKWQLRDVPLTLAEFNRRPIAGPGLFDLGLTTEAVEAAIAAPGFRELVRTFRMPSQSTTAVGLPVGRHLKAGTEYKFEFKSDDLVSFAFIGNGRFVFFKREKGVFRGTIKPGPGMLEIGAKPKGGGSGYAVLLQYVVE